MAQFSMRIGGASQGTSETSDLAVIGPEGRLPLRGHFLPGAYAVIFPLVRSDAIMSEGPAR